MIYYWPAGLFRLDRGTRVQVDSRRATGSQENKMDDISRRMFLVGTPAIGVAAASTKLAAAETQQRPALLGGPKIRPEPFPSWPITDTNDERAILETLRSGDWYRGTGQHVNHFE